MTDQLEQIKASILAGKIKPERLSEWVYQRAWNDALDFSVRQITKLQTNPQTGEEREQS